MRLIRNLFIGLIGLVLLLAAGAYLLPRNVIVEREITIDAPPSEVFPLINSLQRGEEWSPWLERDPEVQISHTGPDAGVDAVSLLGV